MLVMAKKKKTEYVDQHRDPRLAFHCPADIIGRLDAFVAASRPATTQSAVLRDALDEYLTAKGFPPTSEPKK